MFRRPRDPGSTPGRTRKTLNLDPLECVDLLDDAGAAEASRATAAIIAPDQDSLDKACAGRCLCLCQCHFSTEETVTAAAAAQGKKTKTGFIGTIRKKLGMRKKDADSENLSASPSPKSRARSPDRSVAHARSLPRSWKAVPSYSDRTVTIDMDLFVDDTCATTSRVKCRKPRSISQDKNIILSPLKPRRSEKNDKTGTKLSRSGRLVAAPELLSDDDSKELLIQDTGYGHASAPNFNTCDTSPIDVVTCAEKEDDNMACKIDSSQTVPLIPPVYDQVKEPYNGWSLTKELFKLPKYGWYWGPISRAEAEEKLYNQPDGSFLLRDSSDERYLLSLSFRSYGRTLHTRIEHCNGLFSFYAQTESEGYSSIVDLIEHSMSDSQSGVFCYSRARTPGSPSFPVRLAKAISRFTQVRSLQYLCRFVIRQYTRVDYIQRLPLPTSIKGWLEETQY